VLGDAGRYRINHNMHEHRVKHLEMIQAIISRMAGNSFLMKGWTVTLVAAFFALAAKDANQKYVVVALLPALCFWGLDAFYLRQERLFRALYNASIPEDAVVPLFSMDTSISKANVSSWIATLFSTVVVSYHLPIVLAIVTALFLL